MIADLFTVSSFGLSMMFSVTHNEQSETYTVACITRGQVVFQKEVDETVYTSLEAAKKAARDWASYLA